MTQYFIPLNSAGLNLEAMRREAVKRGNAIIHRHKVDEKCNEHCEEYDSEGTRN